MLKIQRIYLVFVAILFVFAPSVFAQEGDYENNFCSDNWSWGGNQSFKDLREVTIPKTTLLKVDGRQNGGISIKGADRNDILIRSCVTTWAKTEEAARAVAENTKVQTAPVVQGENSTGEKGWAVSFQILVPRNIDLDLRAYNGGISVRDVSGILRFETRNGGIHLSQVGGDVKGRTQNGGVHVRLEGESWQGQGLDVQTRNGGVHLSLPENYAARIETETTNGGFKSDFPDLQTEEKKMWVRRAVSRDLNGGGATVRVTTTNGGVHIDSY